MTRTRLCSTASFESCAINLSRCRRRLPRNLMQVPLALIVAACAFLMAARAEAHPHVWVTMTAEVLYAPDGSATAVRHAWTFDDMYSAFATTGIPAKTPGQFTREELQPLAQINAESLKEYDYFTYAKINGKKLKGAFTDPVDYWLDYDPKQTVLTLHFTLPFKKPVKAKVLTVEIYDPEFFIDFGFAEKNPINSSVRRHNARLGPRDLMTTIFSRRRASIGLFIPSEANIGMGANFANRILVQCP